MNYKAFFLILIIASFTLAQGRNGGGRLTTWDESLNLTTEQMQQITQLRESMQPGMVTARQNMNAMVRELKTLKNSDNPDAEQIAELEAQIASSKDAIESMMVAHRAAIRSLLTEEQQLIFDQHEFGPREDRRFGRGMRGGNGVDESRRKRPGNGRW
ncbi:MAG: Spy/CpxP family protein refolding chaperone [Candidatus Marinimicrobia bacterium]|nr:Spy/CpxP family protein refolding chaperone [Candidatus Neomarinimicrobiota bacterium]